MAPPNSGEIELMQDDKRLEQARDRILTNPALMKLRERLLLSTSPPIYLVGGALRDAWLERSVLDFDFAVSGDAKGFARGLARDINARYVLLDDEWGVVRLVWQPPGEGTVPLLNLDFATMQGESIVDDLQQRDFTCNAMALDLVNTGAALWEDPTGGLEDLRAGRLRMVHPSAFRKDPLRLLRTFRLGCSLGLDIEPNTLKAVEKEKDKVLSAAGERIHAELFQLLCCPGSHTYLCLMDQVGMISTLFPELIGLKGLEQGRHHQLDGWNHTLETFRVMEQGLQQGFPELGQWQEYMQEWLGEQNNVIPALKISALLHDGGKPLTYSLGPDGEIHFFGHDREGAQIAVRILQRMRASRLDQDRVKTWIRYHMGALHMLRAMERGHLTERAKIRFLRRLGPDLPGMILLSLADMQAARKGMTSEKMDLFLLLLDSLLHLYFFRDAASQHTPPLLSGKDLMDTLGLAPGPRIGRLLCLLDEARVQGHIHDRSQALDLARSLLKSLRADKSSQIPGRAKSPESK